MLAATVLVISLLTRLCLCDPLFYEADVQNQEIRYEWKNEVYTESEDVGKDRNVDIMVDIDTVAPLNHVEEFFMSFSIEIGAFSNKEFNMSTPRIETAMRGLSPSLIRIGGSSADWTWFNKQLSVLQAAGLKPRVSAISKENLLHLVNLTCSTGSRVLFDLNLQMRFGRLWDPSNFIELLEFCTRENICEDIDWELGNEPSFFTSPGQIVLSEEEIAIDFEILYGVLRSYPCFNKSSLVGPDVVSVHPGSKGLRIIRALADRVGQYMRAITVHHYYFRGDTANYKMFMDPKNFGNLEEVIHLAQSQIAESKHPGIPVWIGETNDAWHSGTTGVSDRFVSGFLWLDKLGLSAQKGVGVIMHHTVAGHNNGFLDENSDPTTHYWLSLLHRRLVGTVVLNIQLLKPPNTLRVYSHCTKFGLYERGAVTLFGLNVSPTDTVHLVFNESALRQQPIDVYMLTPYDGILSKYVMLNGKQRLMMPSDTELPTFKPDHLEPGSKVTLPPLTFGFFVFPQAMVKSARAGAVLKSNEIRKTNGILPETNLTEFASNGDDDDDDVQIDFGVS